MAEPLTHELKAPDGRTLVAREVGAPDGPAIVAQHGTPGSGYAGRADVESAEERGLRLITYDRAGYGGSSPDPGRSVAAAAADVGAVLDALGVERFATYGVSGGGPHALACAALLPDRCAAAATVAGIGPADAPDLDFIAGMGEGNIAEYGVAFEGREPLTEYVAADAEGLLSVESEQLVDAMRPHLSDIDAAALTGELAEFLLSKMKAGLAPGIDGWVDDDLAFVEPWGFDLDSIRVPVLVWQGRQDNMVPPEHGVWLKAHVPGAEGDVFPDEGHLTLSVNRIGDVHAWLLDKLVNAA
jgi:pimeloyl-ACP methyl ester carboxylesterase